MSKTFIAIALILGFALLGYGYLTYNYKIKELEASKQAQAEKLKAEEQAKEDAKLAEYYKQAQYDTCIEEAREVHKKNWNAACETAGKKEYCSLVRSTSDRLDDFHEKEKKICLERFGK